MRWIPTADHIIALDNGRITQQGSFEELNASEGFVRRLSLEGRDDSLIPAVPDENASPQAILNNRNEDEVALSEHSREWSVYTYYARSLGIGSALLYMFITCASAASITYQSEY